MTPGLTTLMVSPGRHSELAARLSRKADLEGHALGHAEQPRLGGGVVGLTDVADLADNGATLMIRPLPRSSMWRNAACDMKKAPERLTR